MRSNSEQEDESIGKSGDEAENHSERDSDEEQGVENSAGSGDDIENDSELGPDEEHEYGPAGNPKEEREDSPAKVEKFDFNRPSVFPNADIDIIRADDPYRPLSIRLNDLLKDRTDTRCQSLHGSWIDVSWLNMEIFQELLMRKDLFRQGADHIWWKSSAFKDLNFLKLHTPQGDESRLTELNMITVIKRSFDTYYNHGLGIIVADEDRLGLPRPSFTVIIRNANTEGKFGTSKSQNNI